MFQLQTSSNDASCPEVSDEVGNVYVESILVRLLHSADILCVEVQRIVHIGTRAENKKASSSSRFGTIIRHSNINLTPHADLFFTAFVLGKPDT